MTNSGVEWALGLVAWQNPQGSTTQTRWTGDRPGGDGARWTSSGLKQGYTGFSGRSGF